MDIKSIVHDLTVALASKSADTPEAIVKAYFDLLPQVKEAVANNHPPTPTARVISKHELLG